MKCKKTHRRALAIGALDIILTNCQIDAAERSCVKLLFGEQMIVKDKKIRPRGWSYSDRLFTVHFVSNHVVCLCKNCVKK